MKNKAPLALMELVIMLLVFALAAALCLKAFHWSSVQSEKIALRDDAVLAVQNVAETMKASKGYAEGSAELNFGGKFTVYTVPMNPDVDGLGGAQISARTPEGDEIFSVKVYWQEPLQDEEEGDGHE